MDSGHGKAGAGTGRLRVRSKVWLEVDSEPVFSKGRAMLLRAIERKGSINAAASEIGIPYRRAWGFIKAMEERLGLSLVETRRGGLNGGGAGLTEAASKLMAGFERLERGVDELVDKQFEAEFGRMR